MDLQGTMITAGLRDGMTAVDHHKGIIANLAQVTMTEALMTTDQAMMIGVGTMTIAGMMTEVAMIIAALTTTVVVSITAVPTTIVAPTMSVVAMITAAPTIIAVGMMIVAGMTTAVRIMKIADMEITEVDRGTMIEETHQDMTIRDMITGQLLAMRIENHH